jgi:predicted  nucleic acid-binding Zn-ribbon protein
LSSVVEHIKALEDLAAMDAEMKSISDKLGEERGTLGALTEGLGKLEKKLEADRAHLAQTEKTKADCAIEVRNMSNQIEHSREKLNRSRTERESNAAQRELEELRKLLKDREEDVGKLTLEADTVRGQIDGTEAEAQKLREQLAAQKGGIESKMSELESQKSGKEGGRDSMVKRLPPQLYRRYEMIRGKRTFAVAQTTDGTCRACHIALPPQLFHKLRREPTIEQCPSCNRLIWFAPPAPAAPKDGG